MRPPTLDEFGTAPDVAAARLLALAAAVAAAYLAALAVAHVVALALRLPRLTRLLLPLTPRILVALIPATLSALPASAQDLPPVTMHLLDEPGPAAPPATTTTTTTTTVGVQPTESVGSAPTPPPPPPPPTSATTHVVRHGEHFWRIATELAHQRLGHAPDTREIVRYWIPLIEANRAKLKDPDNANLIYPGQVFDLPTHND